MKKTNRNKIRVIYGCPPGNKPTGGVKVIYKHSELLNKIGFESHVWHPADETFKCEWFTHSATTIATNQLHPETDFIIIPEIWASGYTSILKNQGFKIGIFVQNCYYTHINLEKNNPNGILDAYQNADLILSISKDTSQYLKEILNIPKEKIIQQRYSINDELFSPDTKNKTITYMPRKMSQHSIRVISAIQPLLPYGWEIKPLDNLNESEVARHLSQSIIFMAFSEFEGLPVPPVEAALSGNIVIGYHGQGGKEYWHAPNFISINQGDIQNFIYQTLSTITKITSNQLDLNKINHGINKLRQHFSKKNETQMLVQLTNNIKKLF